MECNKDEASKAKVISEQQLTENDFAGAKKFALKAQALHPGIEGLSQLIVTINVYVSAGKKVTSGGEVDWYGVLGVNPTADVETIKKQYRKLALMIHPDKNKCIGADGAFKLVSAAWSLLSDKAKRYAYHQRRIRFLNNNVTTNNNNRSSSSQNVRPRSAYATAPPQVIANSFLTNCEKCQKLQEHHNKYQYKTVICSHCRQHFRAVETIIRLSGLSQNVRPRSAYVTAPPRVIANSFLTNCEKCQKLQEHHNKYRYETVICSHCRQRFRAVETVIRLSGLSRTPTTPTRRNYSPNTGGLGAAATANIVHQQANNYRMKRAREEEAQGAGRVCEGRVKVRT